MDLVDQIKSRGGIWRSAGPANGEHLEQLRAALSPSVPEAYFQLLKLSNGGEGDLGVEPGWFCPWPAEEVVANNEGYRVVEFYGDFLAFGSNGGGEMLAFDRRHSSSWPIVMIPFIGGSKHCERIADDFEAFLAQVGRPLEPDDACLAFERTRRE